MRQPCLRLGPSFFFQQPDRARSRSLKISRNTNIPSNDRSLAYITPKSCLVALSLSMLSRPTHHNIIYEKQTTFTECHGWTTNTHQNLLSDRQPSIQIFDNKALTRKPVMPFPLRTHPKAQHKARTGLGLPVGTTSSPRLGRSRSR